MRIFVRSLSTIAILVAVAASSSCTSAMNHADMRSSLDKQPTKDTSLAAAIEASKVVKKPKVKTKISSPILYKLLVAEIAAQRGDIETAIDNYLEVAHASRDVKAASRAAQFASYSQDNQKSLQASKLWVELGPDSPDSHRSYANVLLKTGRAADAIVELKQVAALLANTSDKGYGVIASQLVRVPDRNIAQAVMEKVIEGHHSEPEALFAFSQLLLRLAKFKEALVTIDQVLALKSDWSNGIILKARIIALGTGRTESLTYLKEVINDSDLSDNTDVGISYARMLTENKQFDEALVQFARLTKLQPKHVEIHYLAGVLALQLEKIDQAEFFLKKVIKLGRRLQESNYYLGQIAEQKKDFQLAINHYSSVKHGELYFNAQVRIVALLAELSQYARATEHLHIIRVANAKQELQLNLLEGDVLREAEKFEEAKAFYTKLLVESPNETSILYARALIAEKLGELELVETDLQVILQNEPKNAQVLNALGYTLADRTTRYDEALQYIKRALELEPNDAAVMDSMGWVLYRLGNYDSAIHHLKKANSMDEDPEIAAHFGEVLWVVGKKEEALEIWETSLKKNPQHEILMNVMKRFSQ